MALVELAFTATKLVIVVEAPFSDATPDTYNVVEVAFTPIRFTIVVDAPFKEATPFTYKVDAVAFVNVAATATKLVIVVDAPFNSVGPVTYKEVVVAFVPVKFEMFSNVDDAVEMRPLYSDKSPEIEAVLEALSEPVKFPVAPASVPLIVVEAPFTEKGPAT